MLLGMIADPKEEAFRLAAEEGLDFIEFCINGADTGTYLESILPDVKGWMKKYHLGIGSIGRWKSEILLPDATIAPEEIETAKRLLHLASELECPNYVCGVNYAKDATLFTNYSRAIDFFGSVMDMADPATTVSVYNCKKGNFVSTDEAWSVVLEHLPKLGIKFDPANSLQYGEDYLPVLAKWASRVRHVHLKGTIYVNGKLIDNPPAGMDMTDWASIIGILRSVGYDRGLSLEPHSDCWKGEHFQEGIRYSVNYFDKQLMVRR